MGSKWQKITFMCIRRPVPVTDFATLGIPFVCAECWFSIGKDTERYSCLWKKLLKMVRFVCAAYVLQIYTTRFFRYICCMCFSDIYDPNENFVPKPGWRKNIGFVRCTFKNVENHIPHAKCYKLYNIHIILLKCTVYILMKSFFKTAFYKVLLEY